MLVTSDGCSDALTTVGGGAAIGAPESTCTRSQRRSDYFDDHRQCASAEGVGSMWRPCTALPEAWDAAFDIETDIRRKKRLVALEHAGGERTAQIYTFLSSLGDSQLGSSLGDRG